MENLNDLINASKEEDSDEPTIECIFATCCDKPCKNKAEYYLLDSGNNKIPLCEEHTKVLKSAGRDLLFRPAVKLK